MDYNVSSPPLLRIFKDTIAGMSMVESADGARLTREWLISGIDPEPAATLAHRVLNLSDSEGTPLIPFIGDQHENPALANFFLVSKSMAGFLNGNTSARLRLEYEDLTWMRVTHNGNVVRETTRLDSDGYRLEARWLKGATTYPAEGGTPCDVEAPIFRPNDILEFECYDIGTWANELQYSMVGAINEDPFQGQEPKTWLCVGISGGEWANLGQAAIYRRKYCFEFRGHVEHGIKNSWNVLSWWQGPNWSHPPADIKPKEQGFVGGPDIAAGNGWSYDQVQMSMPFRAFKLPNTLRVMPRLLRDALLKVDADGYLSRPE